MLRLSRLYSLKPIHFRFLNTATSESDINPQPSKLRNFIPIYNFAYIRPLAVINRLKFYQSIVTAVATPISLILNELGVIDADLTVAVISIGVSGCATLFGLGMLTNKFIGFIYLNEKEDLLRIAYIDFWGRRKDVELPLDDLVPLSEVPFSLTNSLYIKLRRLSVEETFKINFKLGKVLDQDRFNKIFPCA